MSATSTIILGWQDLNVWTGLAFSLIALTFYLAASRAEYRRIADRGT